MRFDLESSRVKRMAAQVNAGLGARAARKAATVVAACDEVNRGGNGEAATTSSRAARGPAPDLIWGRAEQRTLIEEYGESRRRVIGTRSRFTHSLGDDAFPGRDACGGGDCGRAAAGSTGGTGDHFGRRVRAEAMIDPCAA